MEKTMSYTDACVMLVNIMDNRNDIKVIKFDRDNDLIDVVDNDGYTHTCIGSQLREIAATKHS